MARVVAVSASSPAVLEVVRAFYRGVEMPIIDVPNLEAAMTALMGSAISPQLRAASITEELDYVASLAHPQSIGQVLLLGAVDDGDIEAAVKWVGEGGSWKHYHVREDDAGPDLSFISFLLHSPTIISYTNQDSFHEMLGNVIMH